MKIDNEILYSLIECDYKGYLKYSGIVDKKYDFEAYLASKRTEYKHKFKENYYTKKLSRKFKVDDFSKNDIISEVNLSVNNLNILSDFVKIMEDKVTGKLIAVPMFVFPREKLTQKEKQYLSFIISILSKELPYIAKYAIAVYGKEQKQTKIYYKEHNNENNKLIGKLNNIKNIELFRNKRCSQCGYDQYCLNIAKEKDMLCLVSGITKNDIRKKNEKGIFSLTQMSYTFRPRRNRAKRKAVNKKRNIELQALTLREKRVHIYEYPDIATKSTELFLDIEGLPDEGYYYLIGVVTKQSDNVDYNSFWADESEEELKIFERFIDFTFTFEDFVVYHYGQYELKALNKYKVKLNKKRQKQLDKIISCSVDVLRTISASVYFPVYSYSLKEISKFIGFNWSNPKASGLQSIVWRKKWEELLEDKFKNYLLTYNSEDCKALLIIKNYLDSFNSTNEDVVRPESLTKKRFSLNFVIGEYSLPEIEVIHEHSSFDYQKEHVFVKSNKSISKQKRKSSNNRRRKYPYNTLVEKKSLKCPVCKSKSNPLNSILKKKVVDLKIKPTGIKRWVTQFFTHRYYCPNCKKSYIPQSYLNIKHKYGHSLLCYTIHQNIVNYESFRQISSNFKDFFDLEIGSTTLNDFKIRFAQYYRKGYVQLENEILQSNIIYVDETPINMRFEKGYIWVLSNGYDVICYYQPNREAEFIRTLLRDFKGILVSDFYSAYDGIDCIHQKCILHLIRDLNDDLVRYPYNHEIKIITKSFSTLMQDIVKTIDKRGFSNKFLGKHIPETINFLLYIKQKDFKSEIAIKYQKRFHRYKDKLFTFLKYDNLSWNNNTAEFAIKQLALHRNDNQKYFHKSRIDDYLVAMSLYITCKYREISFLKFLISGDRIIKAHNTRCS